MAGKCRTLLTLPTRITIISMRNLVISPQVLAYEKRPCVLPVCHQLLDDRTSQYFTSYPYKTKEEMEEPPPPVSDEVRELLQQSRSRWIGPKYLRSQIPPWKFRVKKREMVAAGHVFPEKPMRDRMLDPMPKVKRQIIAKEERVKRIEENMKMMPQWIAEYKEKRRLENEKKKNDKEEQKLAMLQIEKLGLHPKDPRAKQIMQGNLDAEPEKTKKKTKKFSEKKKKK